MSNSTCKRCLLSLVPVLLGPIAIRGRWSIPDLMPRRLLCLQSVTALSLSTLGQNSRSAAIFLPGALKDVHLLLFLFSLMDLGKQKTMAQTFGLQVLCDGCFILALPSVKKLFTDTKSYWIFVAWPYLVLCTSADPQWCWCGFPFPETFYSQPVTTPILLIPVCHFNGNKYRSISDCEFFPTRWQLNNTFHLPVVEEM